ncbi:MAG: HNH endonuclease signature motif containing protein [Acidimicrobiales bacterium]
MVRSTRVPAARSTVLKALVTKGVDVVAVAHAGRSVTAAQRSALEERDRTCVVAGCVTATGLEIDHVDGWALTRTTTSIAWPGCVDGTTTSRPIAATASRAAPATGISWHPSIPPRRRRRRRAGLG